MKIEIAQTIALARKFKGLRTFLIQKTTGLKNEPAEDKRRPLVGNVRRRNVPSGDVASLEFSTLLRLPKIEHSERRLPKLNPDVSPDEARKRVPIVSDSERAARQKKVARAIEIRDVVKGEYLKDSVLATKHEGKSYQELLQTAENITRSAERNKATSGAAAYKARLTEALEHLEAAQFLRQTFLFDHLKPNSEGTSFEKLQRVIGRHYPKLAQDEELVTLVGCFLIKSDKNPDGVFEGLPDNALDPNNANYASRVGVVIKHLFLDLEKRNSVYAVERFSGWDRKLRNYGLRKLTETDIRDSLVKTLSAKKTGDETVKSFLDGDDPIIRPWLLDINKWRIEGSKELAVRACAWVLQHGEKVVKADGSYDIEKIRKIENTIGWKVIFSRHGLHGMFNQCKDVPSIYEAMRLGAEELKRRGAVKKDLFGLDDDQIKPWEIRHKYMWTKEGANGERLIDQVTEYLVERKLRNERPELFKNKGKGELDPKKAKEVNWTGEYNKIVDGCLTNSGITTEEALRRKYPNLFGLGEDQLEPGGLKKAQKWEGEGGLQLLRERIAQNCVRFGIGEFLYRDGQYCYRLTRDQLEWWCGGYFADKKDGACDPIFTDLAGAINSIEVLDRSRINALKVFFGRSVKGQPQVGKLTKRTILSLMKGSVLEIPITSYEIRKQARQIKVDTQRAVSRLLVGAINPYEEGHLDFSQKTGSLDRSGQAAILTAEMGESPLVKVVDSCFATSFKGGIGNIYPTLEKVLYARNGKNQYLLSEDDLRQVLSELKLLTRNINLIPRAKSRLGKRIDELLAIPCNPRSALAQALSFKSSKTIAGSSAQFSALKILDELLGFVASVYTEQKIKEDEDNIFVSKPPVIYTVIKSPSAISTVDFDNSEICSPKEGVNPIEARMQITLKGVSEEKVNAGRKIASQIKNQLGYYERLKDNSDKELNYMALRLEEKALEIEAGTLKPQEESPESLKATAIMVRKVINMKQGKLKVPVLSEKIDYKYFHEIYAQTASKKHIDDPEIETVAMLYCLKSPANPSGVIPEVPSGFFNITSSDFLTRIQTAIRFNLVNVQSRGDFTASKLETMRNFEAFLKWSGLYLLLDDYTELELMHLAFPGIFYGINPPVRPWVIEKRENMNGDSSELARWGLASLLVQEGIFDRLTGTLDLGRLNRLRWDEACKDHGLSKVFKFLGQDAPSPLEAIRQGLEVLRNEELITA